MPSGKSQQPRVEAKCSSALVVDADQAWGDGSLPASRIRHAAEATETSSKYIMLARAANSAKLRCLSITGHSSLRHSLSTLTDHTTASTGPRGPTGL